MLICVQFAGLLPCHVTVAAYSGNSVIRVFEVPTPILLEILITGSGNVQKWTGLFILDITWRRVVTFMRQPHYPWGNDPQSLAGRLHGP
jgi:hypothetical protein